ncbi:MAG: hypothetical protein D6732_09895 [Methanobacteriota archaeon]|nr:MAG: hypothetical protein D6732_09895 [Euryarchaeota archaeon]
MILQVGLGISSYAFPSMFQSVQNRLWFGTSPACQESCLVQRLRHWGGFKIGIATISYLFVVPLKNELLDLQREFKDLTITVGLGDRHRLLSTNRSIHDLKITVEENLSLISGIASSNKRLVQFAASLGLKAILNTGDPEEITAFLDFINPSLVTAYLPVSLPDLPIETRKGYDTWVNRMVGKKRSRERVEVDFDSIWERLDELKDLEIEEVILSAPWDKSLVGMDFVSGLDVTYN